jgi:hypothetical protein
MSDHGESHLPQAVSARVAHLVGVAARMLAVEDAYHVARLTKSRDGDDNRDELFSERSAIRRQFREVLLSVADDFR